MPRPHNNTGCKIENCAGDFYGKGFCRKHFARFMRGKNPNEKSRMEKTVLERFEEKIEKKNGCWLWIGSINNKGYGQFNGDYSHRKSYEIFVGPIPAGMNVLHKCDIPNCCNPRHLWIGTQKQNMQDAKDKGRIASGKRLPQYKHGRYAIAESRGLRSL